MENNGFPLDTDECNKQIDQLQERVDWVDGAVLPFIPPKPKQIGTTVTKVYKINGEYTKQVQDWIDGGEHQAEECIGDAVLVMGAYNRIQFNPINLDSSKQVNEWLLSNGWKPKEWNYKKDKQGKDLKDYYGNKIKTSPKLTKESLEDLEQLGIAGRLIAYRRKATHKRNQIQGFLRNLRPDGTVPSVVNTLGAATGRMTHSKIANVPANKEGNWYKGMRKVFCAPPGYVVVGADCDQCQVRGLAHYMNDQAFIDVMQDPSVKFHQRNADVANVSYGAAKNIYYGYIFGAGIPKTASQIGCTDVEAEGFRKKFASALPGIDPLVHDIREYFRKHGYILGIDGRKIHAKFEHMLLCYLLQDFEAVLIKHFLVTAMDKITDCRLDAKLATIQHDEVQLIVREDHSKEVGKILEESMEIAGTIIGSRCPIKGQAEYGKTWYDTH